VLAVHQLNRNPEGRDNKRPELSDLRDSVRLEQDADLVLFAYRSAYYLERMKFDTQEDEAVRIEKLDAKRNQLELIIAKQRNGPNGTIELFCDMAAKRCARQVEGIVSKVEFASGALPYAEQLCWKVLLLARLEASVHSEGAWRSRRLSDSFSDTPTTTS
jgi:DnaB-like helicase C terminal domain